MARLENYRFGRIVVDGEEHTKDLVVLPTRVLARWWRTDGHRVVLDDLRDVDAELPERLIVGTGAAGRMRPDPETVAALRDRGIDVEVLPTPEAVQRYDESDEARTALALHLTC